MADFTKFKALLEKEKYPMNYTVKFIGHNSPKFIQGVGDFERAHPTLSKQAQRESSGSSNLALTYTFTAHSPDHIISVMEQVGKIPDVRVIL